MVEKSKDPKVNHSEREHALCSASSSSRWLNCPGSVGLGLTVPEPPKSEYAEEGTKAHELAERMLRDWLELGGASCEFGPGEWDQFVLEYQPGYEDTKDEDGRT